MHAGTNSGNRAVTFNATSAGALTGQQVRIVNNFDNVADQILQFTGAAYRFANPTAHAPEPVNFGIVHVGDAVQQALSITNNVPNDGFSERLNASIGSPTGAATTNGGSFTALLPAATNNTDLVVGINTATAGAKTGTATITLTSNGAGTSGLPNTPLTSQTVNVQAQVNNFAAANVVKLSGAGAFNMTGANQFTLDLGSTVEGQAPLVAQLGVVNTAVAPADDLAGSFTVAAPGYSLTGFGPFTGLAAGNTRDSLMVQLNSTMAGTFAGDITLQPQSTNPRPFSMNLSPDHDPSDGPRAAARRLQPERHRRRRRLRRLAQERRHAGRIQHLVRATSAERPPRVPLLAVQLPVQFRCPRAAGDGSFLDWSGVVADTQMFGLAFRLALTICLFGEGRFLRCHHMNGARIRIVFLVALLFETSGGGVLRAAVGTLADSSGEVVGWGDNGHGQTDVPGGTFTAIAAGDYHSLGIRSDGTLAGWGNNIHGQTTRPQRHVHRHRRRRTPTAWASESDGTLAGWGNNDDGQTNVPSGTFTAIAAGVSAQPGHPIRRDAGRLGLNGDGQTNVPSGTFTAIAAGRATAWASSPTARWPVGVYNSDGQTNVPSGTFTAIAAGGFHSLGIRTDGTLAGWGTTATARPPSPAARSPPSPPAISTAWASRSDGTLAGWGDNAFGQTNVPSGTFTAIAAGVLHSLALRARTEYERRPVGQLHRHAVLNGLKANLNRSINVAGDARSNRRLYLYNNPVMNVAGKCDVRASRRWLRQPVGAGTISAGGGLEIVSGTSLSFRPRSCSRTAGPLMGGGNSALSGNARLTAGLTQHQFVHRRRGITGPGRRAELFRQRLYHARKPLRRIPAASCGLTAGQRHAGRPISVPTTADRGPREWQRAGGPAEIEFGGDP